MYEDDTGIRYRLAYRSILRLYLYTIIASACVIAVVFIAPPIAKLILATADLRMQDAQLQALELERQMSIFLWEINERGNPPERVVIEEFVQTELEPSWLQKVFWNWIVPIFGIIAVVLGLFWAVMFLYNRFGHQLIGRSRTTLSLFSVATSIAGMVFAALRYQRELLEHDVGGYLFLSCFFSLVFFLLFIGTGVKLLSFVIYTVLLIVTVLVGWFTSGSVMAVLDEYQTLLGDLTIPLQTLSVLGTLLPTILVISSLLIKPDSVKSAAV